MFSMLGVAVEILRRAMLSIKKRVGLYIGLWSNMKTAQKFDTAIHVQTFEAG